EQMAQMQHPGPRLGQGGRKTGEKSDSEIRKAHAEAERRKYAEYVLWTRGERESHGCCEKRRRAGRRQEGGEGPRRKIPRQFRMIGTTQIVGQPARQLDIEQS